MPSQHHPPLFITARFRTGSTMIWNIFRQLPDVVALYEPLHGQLPGYISHPNLVRKEHLYVKSYFDEYQSIKDCVEHHRTDFSDHRLYLEEGDDYPELKEYIQVLLNSVSPGKTCVIKFNRIDFRLPWIKKNFPDAKIMHLSRNPRTQWYSTIARYEGNIDTSLEFDDFFVTTFARDLYRQFPFLSGPYTTHIYQRFYYLWKLSLLAGQRLSGISLTYENFLQEPEHYLHNILDFANLDTRENFLTCKNFIDSKPKRSWTKMTDESQYEEIETRCNALLDKLGINHDLTFKPLKEIQAGSIDYQEMCADSRPAEWALLSLKRAYEKEFNTNYILSSELLNHECPYRIELENIKVSGSWKITAPLRKMTAMLRNFKSGKKSQPPHGD
jgi:hypothetical protein